MEGQRQKDSQQLQLQLMALMGGGFVAGLCPSTVATPSPFLSIFPRLAIFILNFPILKGQLLYLSTALLGCLPLLYLGILAYISLFLLYTALENGSRTVPTCWCKWGIIIT